MADAAPAFASLDAMEIADGALPVIDIAALRVGGNHIAVAAAIRAACLDKGFFYIANHGVADALVQSAFAQARDFFALPLEAKQALSMANAYARSNRGYSPIQGQTLEAGTPPDLKESFYIGIELSKDDPRVVAGKMNHGPNQWPAELPRFRPVLDAYFAAMRALVPVLWRGLALSLDLEETYFEEFCREPTCTVRLLHYPPQPAAALPGEKGCGAHTDFGGLTVLAQDGNGGLQVWDERRGWLHVPPIPGTFVVNLGDLMARWTNDRYRSTMHRVVNISGKERYSLPFFFPGNPDYRVECLPTCHVPGVPDKYPPTTVSAHFAEVFRRSYA